MSKCIPICVEEGTKEDVVTVFEIARLFTHKEHYPFIGDMTDLSDEELDRIKKFINDYLNRA